MDIARLRLHNQWISAPVSGTPAAVVAWLGASQAQDYAGAKWALGLRLQGATDSALDQAFSAGALLRTHLLRPTWHFVTPADIRWLLALTAPRVHAANAHMYRKLELDSAVFARSEAALVKALRGGGQLTREELAAVLQQAGIKLVEGQRLAYLMMHAELEGVLCSGPRRGKQFTYALLEERAPHARVLGPEEALAELAKRYFLSRGPATVHDFAKWSGLTVSAARQGLAAVQTQLEQVTVDEQVYWLPPAAPAARAAPRAAYLLSIYDEYVSGYQDRGAIATAETGARLVGLGNALSYIVVVAGQIVGTWKRTLGKGTVTVKLDLFVELAPAPKRAVAAAAERYGEFLQASVTLV